ncbi:MAG: NAD(+)/NADH kinase, partial [Brevinematia bacterium]
MSKIVAVVYNPNKEEVKYILSYLPNLLSESGIDFFLVRTDFKDFSASFDYYNDLKKPDFVLCVGGDGTILYASRLFARYNIPIAGIDLGKLGFLMHFSKDELVELINSIKEDSFIVEERMMINADIQFEDGRRYLKEALNEVVVSRGKYHRLLDVEVFINDDFLNSYRADGVIVSTPTGSTAYSFSALGPILLPTMKNLIITPICPHSLFARSIVLDEESYVTLKVKHSFPTSVIVVD